MLQCGQQPVKRIAARLCSWVKFKDAGGDNAAGKLTRDEGQRKDKRGSVMRQMLVKQTVHGPIKRIVGIGERSGTHVGSLRV